LAWSVEVSARARKQLEKVGPNAAGEIARYLKNRVAPTNDPRQFGKSLAGDLSGYWRYRVGDYRIICELIDERLVVLVVEIGHRSEVYR